MSAVSHKSRSCSKMSSQRSRRTLNTNNTSARSVGLGCSPVASKTETPTFASCSSGQQSRCSSNSQASTLSSSKPWSNASRMPITNNRSYNTTYFIEVGVQHPFLISMITTIVNVCSTPVSFYTIERYGRRPLLIYGAIAMAVCELVIASVWISPTNSAASYYVLSVFVCLYVFFFASTWGPTGWVVIGEIFQLPIRAKGVALSTASNWFWNCIIG